MRLQQAYSVYLNDSEPIFRWPKYWKCVCWEKLTVFAHLFGTILAMISPYVCPSVCLSICFENVETAHSNCTSLCINSRYVQPCICPSARLSTCHIPSLNQIYLTTDLNFANQWSFLVNQTSKPDLHVILTKCKVSVLPNIYQSTLVP
jgi:hypothetical protein